VQKTAARERGRPLLVDLHPGYLVLRLKGTQASLADFARARFLVAGQKALPKSGGRPR
jgi:hypothetical protein